MQHRTVTEEVGQRLDNYLLAQFRRLPRSRVYRMLRSGEVRVNGGRARAGYRLQSGDQVRLPPVRLPDAEPAPAPAEALRTQLHNALVFSDDDVLVLDKPCGLAVHGGSGVSLGLIEALRQMHPEPLELVHRLDRDTSGLIVVARRRSALRRWQAAFRPGGGAVKRYLAVVAGTGLEQRKRIELPLIRYLTPSGERRVRVDPEGKPARTDIRLLGAAQGYSVLLATLRTGRTHQIRAHLRALDHPVLGDEKYAPPPVLQLGRTLGVERLALHAWRLSVAANEGPLRLEAPVPASLMALVDSAGVSLPGWPADSG